MHISEGVLSAPILLAGGSFTLLGLAIGLKKIEHNDIAKVGLLSAAFFVGSLINIPAGPASIHLMLSGLVGILLGWAAFPAIFIGLVLQAILFQVGGITVLGVNTFNIAVPGILVSFFVAPYLKKSEKISFIACFAGGFLSILLSAFLLTGCLIFTHESFSEIAYITIVANFPVMILEGIITAFCISFLKKVKPDLLPA